MCELTGDLGPAKSVRLCKYVLALPNMSVTASLADSSCPSRSSRRDIRRKGFLVWPRERELSSCTGLMPHSVKGGAARAVSKTEGHLPRGQELLQPPPQSEDGLHTGALNCVPGAGGQPSCGQGQRKEARQMRTWTTALVLPSALGAGGG